MRECAIHAAFDSMVTPVYHGVLSRAVEAVQRAIAKKTIQLSVHLMARIILAFFVRKKTA